LREDEKLKPLVAGIEATTRELDKVFNMNAIQKVAAHGLPLDPNQHQAMIDSPRRGRARHHRSGAPAWLHHQGPPAASGHGGRRQEAGLSFSARGNIARFWSYPPAWNGGYHDQNRDGVDACRGRFNHGRLRA
jgi:hypothetical protein